MQFWEFRPNNMKLKTGIAGSFIAFGTLFILAPTVLFEIYSRKLSQLILQPTAEPGTVFYYLTGPMDYHGQIACWSSGIALICAAFLFRQRRGTQELD